jgi:hypothetical protein
MPYGQELNPVSGFCPNNYFAQRYRFCQFGLWSDIYKTQKVKNPVLYLLPITWDDLHIISCDLAHQKRSICDAPWHDARSKPGDHWMLTFSHGTRVCFFFFCSKVEMFFSSLWKYFIYYFSFPYLRSAKIGFFYISSKQLDK